MGCAPLIWLVPSPSNSFCKLVNVIYLVYSDCCMPIRLFLSFLFSLHFCSPKVQHDSTLQQHNTEWSKMLIKSLSPFADSLSVSEKLQISRTDAKNWRRTCSMETFKLVIFGLSSHFHSQMNHLKVQSVTSILRSNTSNKEFDLQKNSLKIFQSF